LTEAAVSDDLPSGRTSRANSLDVPHYSIETLPSSEEAAVAAGDVPPADRRGRRIAVAVIASLTVVGALVTVLACWYVFLRPTSFTSEALVAVLPDDPGAPDSSVDIAAVWVQIGNARTVLDPVAAEVGSPEPEIQSAVTVSQPDRVQLLSIKATASDPDASAIWANAVAAQLLQQDRQGRVGHYHLQQVTEARPAVHADSTPGTAGAVGAALVGGAAGALLGRSIVHYRDRSAMPA
jgi:capsular polysaccharide biosynthesis protein